MREMKESGLKWIGNVPYNWKIAKVKDVFIRKNEKANEENPIVLSLARSGVKIRDISNGEGQLAESYSNYNPVEINDLLLNPMDLYSGANCSVSKVKGVISPAYINLKAKGNNNSTYYDYYFKTQYWSMAFFAHGKGVSFDNRWTLGLDSVMNYYVPVPSENEQQKIANFLDKKISEIDNVIEKTKETIEDYKKYKQSIITEAVTKGLDKNVEMKDSGHIWIGKIPFTWKCLTIKNVVSILKCGIAATPEYVSEDDGVLFLSAQNIKNDKIDFSIKRYISRSLHERLTKNVKPQKGDILQIRVGATIGKTAIVEFNQEYSIYVSLSLIRVNDKILNTYMKYYLSTNSFRQNAELFIDFAGSQGNLNVESLKNMYITLPSKKEQQEIVNYLDIKCEELNNLIESKEKIIEELEQYKKSLIYEYVTGKKEVI